MIIKQLLHKKDFMNICSKLEYKTKDNKEVEHITSGSLNNVYDLYKSMNTKWAEYYIIEHEGKVICTIILTLDNYLHYFVTKDLALFEQTDQDSSLRALIRDEITLGSFEY